MEQRGIPQHSTDERLQRVLAASGVASRRKSEDLIRAGRVTVNGTVITKLGTKVDPARTDIRVDGKPIRRKPLRYIVLHKPSGFITTTDDERGRHTVMDLLPKDSGVYPVGRLDRDTEGLLLLTNDGDVANRVMHPRYKLTKEYVIETPAKPPESAMRTVRGGMAIEGKRVVPHEFRLLRETPTGALLSIVIHEGINHVVRRLMDAVGIEVTSLRRVRVGPLSLTGIPRGAHRELTSGEVTSLQEALHIQRGDAASRPIASQPTAQHSPATKRRSRERADQARVSSESPP